MSKAGKYVYGIINSSTEEFYDLGETIPFEDIDPFRSPTEAENSKKTSNCAYTVSFQDIAAVVSDSEIVDYSHAPKETIARLLVGHQQLIERVMSRHTIIPMRLGTFAQSHEEVLQILASGYRAIQDIFERTKNAIEIDVVATLSDFSSFLREVSNQEDIRQLKQSLLGKEGGVTLDDQMRVGLLVKKQLDRKREIYADRIQAALGELAQCFKAHDLMDDTMVLNTAFLIDRDGQKEFERRVEALNEQFQEKMNFRCVGPLPPYSFYSLEVKKPRFEDIDWARKTLGLEDNIITDKEIKKAHHRAALTCHPDKHPDAPGIEKKFDEMTRAYKILLEYYRYSAMAGHNEGCCLSEQAFDGNAVLVTTMG